MPDLDDALESLERAISENVENDGSMEEFDALTARRDQIEEQRRAATKSKKEHVDELAAADAEIKALRQKQAEATIAAVESDSDRVARAKATAAAAAAEQAAAELEVRRQWVGLSDDEVAAQRLDAAVKVEELAETIKKYGPESARGERAKAERDQAALGRRRSRSRTCHALTRAKRPAHARLVARHEGRARYPALVGRQLA